MQYYHVWVRSDRYRASEPLTYSHPDNLLPGTVVLVPLRKEVVFGFVVAGVARPHFTVKPMSSILPVRSLSQQTIELAAWLVRYYGAPIGTVTTLLLPKGLHERYIEAIATPDTSTIPPETVRWTSEQEQALATITKPDTYLLHGRTGSGKTKLYIELTRRALQAGRSALILSPEIGLTSQLASQFRAQFGERVIVLHSQLTAKERALIWLQVVDSETPLIVIGPRSALFSPLRELGLIVVDEAHDSAYKQEQPPYYHAVRVAAQLRQLHDATLVLGSATPSVADYYVALARHKPIIRLQELARRDDALERQVHVIDLKDRSQFSRAPHLSLTLIEAVQGSLERQEQALLYLNRRGTARVTVCDVCGWQALCPHCDLPLAYHGDTFTLRCHTCGFVQAPITACPVCGNQSVILRSFGTKAIVEEAQRLFPRARIMRFDTDSAKRERLEQQYESILRGEVDILVGTQMLGKGLDLPRLSTLGIILADSSLYLPDYTATERTYQLLTQVMGRVGRGHVASQAVVQTYYPDSSLLAAATHDDWQTFYDREITERCTYLFPPFSYLLKLSCRRKSTAGAEKAAQSFHKTLLEQGLPVQIDGPMPAFHEKVAGAYEWQLVIKARDRGQLLKIIPFLPAGWNYDLDPSDLL